MTSDERPASHPRPPTRDPLAVTEATLSRLWAGQRFPAAALVTIAGVPLRVLHPGRAGRGAGPDFRDALIAGPFGRVLRGDVELHLRERDFRAHGHDRDPRYDRVVLHVVFEGGAATVTKLRSGREAPVVALEPWVRRRARVLAGWLESPALWREPCHDAIARLGREQVLRELDELGDRRFRGRAERMAEEFAVRGAGDALYRALLDGLGYGGQRALFERVAHRLPLPGLLHSLSDKDGLCRGEALLLQAAGPLSSMGRPANRPDRRLAGLARLLARHRRLFEDPPELADLEGSLRGPAPALIGAWIVTDGRGALIGRSRAIELLTNAVLPWTAALGDARLEALAHDAFAWLPRPAAYGALAFLESNLQNGAGKLPLDARRQQGLLALYKSECSQGGCGRCALS